MRAVSLLFHDVFVRDPAESGFRSAGADRYKVCVTDFEAHLSGIASVRAEAPILAGGDFGAGHAHALPFLLTFDDGGLSYHSIVADRLEARGWRGHCFVSTDLIGRAGFLDARQIRELDARGHVIGSHTASHPARFSACSPSVMRREWSQSRQMLEDLLGHSVEAASVPGGYFSRTVAETARDAGLRVLFTSEPTTALAVGHACAVMGRFTVRHHGPADLARRLVVTSPWARRRAWASWNAKGLLKPVLGPHYGRVADWFLAGQATGLSS